jgi:two-component system alkaline phosphatase synthesis response regulator PhoP
VKILVADDEPTIREMARELLTHAGYDVLEASDGRQALALARKEQPVLILLDLVMPEMNGFEFILEIRKDPRVSKTPILVLSALVSESDTDAYIHELDVVGFIGKTVMATSLISRVQEILSKQAHQVA